MILISEFDCDDFPYWNKRIDYIAKEFNNSDNYWQVINNQDFIEFAKNAYGLQIICILEQPINFVMLGIEIVDYKKKLILDIKA